MTGWLVVNEFLTTNKYSELNQWLLKAAEKRNIELEIKTNAQLMVGLPYINGKPDFVLFWDKDIRLANYLEDCQIPVFNSAKSIEICDDKSYTYLQLLKANLPMPKTVLGPKTFDTVGYKKQEFLKDIQQYLGYPLVVKECFGSFGQQVYLAKDYDQLVKVVESTCPKPILFQEFVESSFGRDVRIQVVGDQVVASMYRYSENGDFRANLSIGGSMQPYEPNEEEIKLAVDCVKAIGLDFAGVDLLFGTDDKPIICEVNSNAHFKNIYDCTKVDVAGCILDYIMRQLSTSNNENNKC